MERIGLNRRQSSPYQGYEPREDVQVGRGVFGTDLELEIPSRPFDPERVLGVGVRRQRSAAATEV